MKKHNTIWIAWIIVAASLALSGLAAWLYRLNLSRASLPDGAHISWFNLVMALMFPPVGLLILRSLPANLIGRLFLALGLGQALGQFGKQYAFYGLVVDPGALPLATILYWLQNYIWYPSFCLLTVLLVLFPDGRPPTRRWRWLIYWVGAAVAVFTLTMIVEPLQNPQHWISFSNESDGLVGLNTLLFDLAVISMLGAMLVAVIALALRFRRSRGVERQQMKWFAFAGLIFGLVFATLSFLSAWPVLDPTVRQSFSFTVSLAAFRVLFPLAVALFPLAMGVAILRYKLYGIDVIIRRALVYSALTVLLALIYFSLVLGLQTALFWLAKQARSDLAVIFSTLAIASLFAPLRGRVQAAIDRRFYRGRYDVEQALTAFRNTLRQEVDLLTIVAQTEGVVDQTIQPEAAFIWLMPPKRE